MGAYGGPCMGGKVTTEDPAPTTAKGVVPRAPARSRARIFLSYRRNDSRHATGRLHDDLKKLFERDAVFVDIDSIPKGAGFADEIDTALSSVAVVCVIIGERWASDPRLHEPEDWVALEVATALSAGVEVIPVLLDDTEIPAAEQLPEALRPLFDLNVMRVRDTSYDQDLATLAARLRQLVPHLSPVALAVDRLRSWSTRSRMVWVVGALITILSAGLVVQQLYFDINPTVVLPVMEGSAANNIAVFPFDGETAPNYSVSGLVETELEGLAGWQVAGPSFIDRRFPQGDVDEVNERLAEHNIGLAIYGTVDARGFAVNVWLTPAVRGAALAGVVGPLELCCTPDPGNLSDGGRADLIRRQTDHWVNLLEYLEVLHNVDAIECGDLTDCENADAQLARAVDELLTPIIDSPVASSEVRNLARAFNGSTFILRRTFTEADGAHEDPLLDAAEAAFQAVLDDPTASASATSRVELVMARVDLLRAGCGLAVGDPDLLALADEHIEAAEALVPAAANLDPIELELRIGIARTSLSMCRTSFDLADARETLAEFDEVIDSYEAQNDAVRLRLTLFMPSTYLQRGQLRDQLGEPGADDDYAKAVEHSPRLFRRFYLDQREAAAAARAGVDGEDEPAIRVTPETDDNQGDESATAETDDEPGDESATAQTADEQDGTDDSFGVPKGGGGAMSGDTVQVAAPLSFASAEATDLPTRQVIYSAAALAHTNGFDCESIGVGPAFYGSVTRAGHRVVVICVPVDDQLWNTTVIGPDGEVLIDAVPTLLRSSSPCCGPQVLFRLDAAAGPYTIRAERSDGVVESAEFFLPPLSGRHFQSVWLDGAPHLLIAGFPHGPLELTAFTVVDRDPQTKVLTLGSLQPFVVDVQGITVVPVALAGATSTCVIPSARLTDRTDIEETSACFIQDISEPEALPLVRCSIDYPSITVGEQMIIRAIVRSDAAIRDLAIDDGAGAGGQALDENTLLAHYDEPGTYTPTIRWSTADGMTGSVECDPIHVRSTQTLEIRDENSPATLVYSCSLLTGPLESQTQGGYLVVVEPGERIGLDFYADGVIGPEISLLWDHGDGTTDDRLESSLQYDAEGVYTVTLTWQGPDGGATVECGTVIVGYPPNSYVSFRCMASPGFTVRVGEELELQSGSWPVVEDATFRWDLGSGDVVEGSAVAVHFRTAGEYRITLFWDRAGESGQVACPNAVVLPEDG